MPTITPRLRTARRGHSNTYPCGKISAKPPRGKIGHPWRAISYEANTTTYTLRPRKNTHVRIYGNPKKTPRKAPPPAILKKKTPRKLPPTLQQCKKKTVQTSLNVACCVQGTHLYLLQRQPKYNTSTPRASAGTPRIYGRGSTNQRGRYTSPAPLPDKKSQPAEECHGGWLQNQD